MKLTVTIIALIIGIRALALTQNHYNSSYSNRALFLPYYSNYANISAWAVHTGASTGVRIRETVTIGAFGSLDHIQKELYYGGYLRTKLMHNPYVQPAVSCRIGNYAGKLSGEAMVEGLIDLSKLFRLEAAIGINRDLIFGEIRIQISKYE